MGYVLVAGVLLAAVTWALWATRRYRWSLLWWIPLTLWLIVGAGWAVFGLLTLRFPSGPGGGGEGVIVLMFLALCGGLCILAGLFLAFMPRGPAWNRRAVVAGLVLAISFPAGTIIVGRVWHARTFYIHVVDAAGKPVAATVQYRLYPDSLFFRSQQVGSCATDAAGNVSFAGQTFETLYLTLTQVGSTEPEQQVNLYRLADGSASVEMDWSTSFPGFRSGLSQQFHEQVHGGKTWEIAVELPVGNGMVPPFPYRDRLKRMVLAGPQQDRWPHTESAAFLNVGALELAPTVIQNAASVADEDCVAAGQLRAMLTLAGDAEWRLGPIGNRGHYLADDFLELLKAGPLPQNQVGPVTRYLDDVRRRIVACGAAAN